MRVKEVISEAKRKPKPLGPGDTTPHDWNPGWEDLNWLKENAARTGARLAGSYQLFVPRANSSAATVRDRRLKNLANAWAWDDEGNLKPQYARFEEPPREMTGLEPNEVAEAAPILSPGKASPRAGWNKPHAHLWTSTAVKNRSGWSSDWSRFIAGRHPDWFSEKGYLYKVKPGALILEISSEHDAERIYHTFERLGLAKPIDYSSYSRLTGAFPWDQIAKHFDAVWHGGYGYNDDFTSGWDVESTAWLDTSFLQLIGEVPVAGYDD